MASLRRRLAASVPSSDTSFAPLLVEEVFDAIKSLKAQRMTIFLVEQNAFAAWRSPSAAMSWKPAPPS